MDTRNGMDTKHVTGEPKRGPGRPRKQPETPAEHDEPSAIKYIELPRPIVDPPGPIILEIRAGAPGQTKIVCSQRVHTYRIDQQPDTLTVTGELKP
jgi:hypothetical protein